MYEGGSIVGNNVMKSNIALKFIGNSTRRGNRRKQELYSNNLLKATATILSLSLHKNGPFKYIDGEHLKFESALRARIHSHP